MILGLVVVVVFVLLIWFLYEVRTAPLVEDEVDELLQHLYGKDEQ